MQLAANCQQFVSSQPIRSLMSHGGARFYNAPEQG